jgi:hypothetical protein
MLRLTGLGIGFMLVLMIAAAGYLRNASPPAPWTGKWSAVGEMRKEEASRASSFFAMEDRVRVILLLLLALTLAGPARAHEEWAWISEFKNWRGDSCCSDSDAVVISAEVANGAKVGSLISAPFASGPVLVEVNKIYQTQDKRGRAWITLYGCLFRHNGV